MNHYISGIIKSLILEAQMAFLLFDRVLLDRFVVERKWVLRVLTALMVLAWCNFVGLRGNFGLVHEWEQFHFYLGAKYQKELGWFDLYKAAVLADRETIHVITSPTIRDIHNFELVPIDTALTDGPRVRSRFSDARWEEFKRDWVAMVNNRPIDFNRVVQDHGNSNSPAWAVIAHPIAELLPLTRGTQTFIGLLDFILMGVMFFFVFKTFGERTGCIALLMWATPGIVFDYLAGSFLRWDWLFALGMSVVMMKREKWALAGGFFAYAVATKLFPICFGVALLFKALVSWQKDKKLEKRYVRFGLGAAGTGAAIGVLAALMFGGFWCWTEYKERIDVARYEKFYAIQYSLQTVYLQFAASTPSEAIEGWFAPNEIKQARADVDLKDYQGGFFIFKLLFSFLVLLMVLRSDDIGAFTLGPLLVFTWLTVNMYYWNMFGLLALGLSRREERPPFVALVTLHIPFIVFYIYQHLNRGMSEGYIVAFFLCVWMLNFAWMEWRESKGLVRELLGIKGGAPAPAKR
ncbi:MAG: hypothetical protein QM723_03955 [Myxococcaceae bacterium]